MTAQVEDSSTARRLTELLRRLPWEGRIATRPPPWVHRRAQLRLRHLLRGARARSPWWRTILADVDIESFDVDDLIDLPVMTRAQLLERWDHIAGDRRLTIERADHHLAGPGQTGALLDGSYHLVTTSGTTGAPLVIPWGAAGWLRMALTTIRTASSRPDQPAEVTSLPKVLSVFGTDIRRLSGAISASWSSPIMQIVAVSALEGPDALREHVMNERPTELRGYPSVLRRLAMAVLSEGWELPPMRIGVSGEVLTAATAELITRAFGVVPFNSWGATEGGWVAFSGADPTWMRVAEDACVVESVDGRNQPVPHGSFGEAVLLTPLINPAFPLIRYRVNDSVCLERRDDALMMQVRGRSPGVFTYGRGAVGHDCLADTVERQLPVADYRIGQTPGGIVIEVAAALSNEARRRLRTACEPVLRSGQLLGASIDIETGRGPWQLPSGKSSRIIVTAGQGSSSTRPRG